MAQEISQSEAIKLLTLKAASNPPANPLEICEVFSDVHFRNNERGTVLMHFKLLCKKGVSDDNSLVLSLKNSDGEFFKDSVNLYKIKTDDYPGKTLRRTQTLTLNEKDYLGNEVELTFSNEKNKITFNVRI